MNLGRFALPGKEKGERSRLNGRWLRMRELDKSAFPKRGRVYPLLPGIAPGGLAIDTTSINLLRATVTYRVPYPDKCIIRNDFYKACSRTLF